MSDLKAEANFVCARCGECCRISGQIRLTTDDITRLAAFFGLSEHDFIQQYTDLSRDRRNLVVKGDPNLPCPFLVGNECSVYPARPAQCATYPFKWTNPDWRKICKL